MDDRAAAQLVARVESLLAGLDDRALEAVQALVALYGEGLERTLARCAPEALEELADDPLVQHLMVVHDLHPVPLEERVRGALEDVRPYMASHGGGVELLGVDGAVVRLRLNGSCDGCPSSAMTLKLAVEDAIRRAAPEVESVEAEGAAEATGPELLQLQPADAVLGERPGVAWSVAGGLPQLSGGGTLVTEVSGEPLLFLRVEADLYAYRPACPGCGGSLEDAALCGAELRCQGCGNAYDVRRAGRCLDAPQLHLEPVPLLEGDAGVVKVAVGAAA